MSRLVIYIIAIALIIYSLRSIIAGFKNETRIYWTKIPYDGLRDLLKDNYVKVINIAVGIISLASGILVLIFN